MRYTLVPPNARPIETMIKVSNYARRCVAMSCNDANCRCRQSLQVTHMSGKHNKSSSCRAWPASLSISTLRICHTGFTLSIVTSILPERGSITPACNEQKALKTCVMANVLIAHLHTHSRVSEVGVVTPTFDSTNSSRTGSSKR